MDDEPVENLVVGAGGIKVGDVVTKSDGPEFFGTAFEFQDEGFGWPQRPVR